ncbi:AtpZ/AtpI family protein [Candidatus Kuenenbacteria bacterium]|nr:AtpZ/AtpI family protein [Candidatus Kuenenbacteria bacterium]
MAMPIIIFTLLGKYLDNLLHKRFLFILLGGAFGIGLGMHFVYKRAEVIRDDLYGKK